MSFKIDSLLKDKVILYIVLFFAVTNFFGYIMMNNYDAIISMILAGLITSYFSKNMIVILLISIIGGSLVTGASSINEGVKHRVREGMGNKENFKGVGVFDSSHSGDEKDDDSDKEKAEKAAAAEKASATHSPNLEKAMDRLDEILGGSSIDALLKNQQGLTKAVGALEPLMNKAEGMINSITSTGLVDRLTGMTKKMEGKI